MKRGTKIFLIITAIGVLTVFTIVVYLFNKPHRDIENEVPAYSMTAEALFNIYSFDKEMSNNRYADKVIQINGKIAEILIENQQICIILYDDINSVDCMLHKDLTNSNSFVVSDLKPGDNITIKGKCDGFDMIMGVVLTQCFIIQ